MMTLIDNCMEISTSHSKLVQLSTFKYFAYLVLLYQMIKGIKQLLSSMVSCSAVSRLPHSPGGSWV
eukprot:2155725-Amphidinium_carterae.1